VIDVCEVSKTYRRGDELVHALRDVTFSLGAGEVVALLGPSGSGKSTLLNVLCGWEDPDHGTVTWDAIPLDGATRSWAHLALLPQALGLLEDLSVRENVELPVRLGGGQVGHGGVVGSAADALLAALGLDDLADRAPEEVSLGEQQRAALARALVCSSRLVLADEPTSHQDEAWVGPVFGLLRAAADTGSTCLVATHDPEGLAVADRVLTIRDGRVAPV